MSEVWPPTKLGDCCDILDSMRVPLNSEQRDAMKGDIPYYGANGLQGYIDKFIFDEPLILLAEDGGYFDEYETRPIAYRISGKSWVNNHAHVLRAIAGRSFCQDYIFYCLEHKNINPFIKGGTRAKLNQSELREILIPNAPEPQQRRIADILSTLDETIEQTEALIAKMQKVKVGLMHDLFTRGVTPDGRLRPTREQAPELYKKSPLGWIPKEWDAGRLDHYLDPTAGIKPGPFGSSLTKDNYVSSGFRVYGQEQVIAGTLEIGDYFISEAKFLEMSGFEVLADDVLISLVGTVGCVLVAKPPFERGIINPRLMRLRPARGVVVTSFLKHLLLSVNVRRQIDILAGGGTMPVINGKIIRRLAIPILSYDEQVRLAERIDVIDTSLESFAEELAKLLQQKHGLMYDLLTGRVRVQ